MNLNWTAIRSINGSQAEGFEKLCVQLADAEKPDGASFVPKGKPDAGVECYCVLADGSEWGWQAKYFLHALGSTQWNQIDDSVKTALDKHPKLVRYFLCVPRDLPDARISGQKSALDRWHEHVTKWNGWAQERGRCVEFCWWGEHKLLDILSKTKHIGRRHFWFNERCFDADWFQNHLNAVVTDVGPRYTPKVHIDLRIADVLALFGHMECAFAPVKLWSQKIQDQLYAFRRLNRHGHEKDRNLEDPMGALWHTGHALLSEMQTSASTLKKLTPSDRVVKINRIVEKTAKAIVKTGECIHSIERQLERDVRESALNDYNGPMSQQRLWIYQFQDTLDQMQMALHPINTWASKEILLLVGDAGTGKTHLLCDAALNRLKAQYPTILLLGQHFSTLTAPWIQVLQRLDLPTSSEEEFIGALEAIAQTVNRRALLILDGLNEGLGCDLWPDNLPSFLRRLEASPWIAVVLSVRSTYLDIIPKAVCERATKVYHHGFGDQVYDATQTFFSHYQLELPLNPVWQAQFHNPLFLKIFCEGLARNAIRQMPQDGLGITAIFVLYCQGINRDLARSLRYDPDDELVRAALHAFAQGLVDCGTTRSLPKSKAKKAIDAGLPGRDFEHSLYRGLVTEGVLTEDRIQDTNGVYNTVRISYERFSDYVIVDCLLQRYRDVQALKTALGPEGSLAFLWETDGHALSGIVEALCVCVPERTRQELIRLAPQCLNTKNIGAAFRQSIVWRKRDAFSDATWSVLCDLIRSQQDMDDTVNLLLTVATIDGHPLNAEFLDGQLRQFSMSDRDAWWSTSLYRLWEEHRQLGKQSSVDYLVHWAWTSPSRGNIDETTVELCAIALAWMLATSHRFLRDRATKALVALLTGRLEATAKWVARFSDVDDLYIAERIYAVAYGVALHSYDAQGVGQLASQVYNQAFAHHPPPVHILLRDYARGVIERAAWLGTEINIDMQRVRPPYRSTWPAIPSEQVIQQQLDGWHEASTLEAEQGQEAGWRSIDSSLAAVGDFARYVIGVDKFLPSSSRWLSLRRDQATPLCGENAESIPQFDLKEVQRYVLQRVATLGWTHERFGCFDSGVARNSSGRQADKPERIGKKYQWIAYHEILAYLADHYQYRDGNQYAYSGPWQIGVRDIDPSCTPAAQPSSASAGPDCQPIWWEPMVHDGWEPEVSHQAWLEDGNDFPSVPDSLMVSNPQKSNVKWLRARRYYIWPSSPPADEESYNDGYRELRTRTIGYLVPSAQIDDFREWAQVADFREEEIHDRFPVCGSAFLGEYGWSPAFRHRRRELDDDTEGLLLGRNCPVRVSVLAWNYTSGFGGFDCSVDAPYALELPDPEFVQRTGLCWTGAGADFVNETGETAAFDPAAHAAGPSALLIRADVMDQYLTMQDRVLCWIMMGEKSIRENTQFYGDLKVRGVYTYQNGTIEGDYQVFPYASRQY